MFFVHWILRMNLGALFFFNAITGGDPTMTPSARAGYAREHGSKGGACVCHVLGWLDPSDGHGEQDHCNIAIIHDKLGNHHRDKPQE